jgi:hypothetical protein
VARHDRRFTGRDELAARPLIVGFGDWRAVGPARQGLRHVVIGLAAPTPQRRAADAAHGMGNGRLLPEADFPR